jgi:SNF2 family DNA or RNA helicase
MKPSNKYIEKLAKMTELRSHQADALSLLDENDGIVLHHSTGSGKTKTFLTAAKKALDENPGRRALVIAPASLVSNVDKELKKHSIKLDKSRMDVMSYEKAVRSSDELEKKDYAIAIADEAHKLRNTSSKRSQLLSRIISQADKRILATGTANYNHIADISPLVNMAAGQKALVEDQKIFEGRHTRVVKLPQTYMEMVVGKPREEVTRLKNVDELKYWLGKHVHYYDSAQDPQAAAKFPELTEKTVPVEMSPEQKKFYDFAEGQIPYQTRMKIRNNLPLDKQEKSLLNSFSIAVRQASNGMRHLVSDKDSVGYSPKLLAAANSLETKMKSDKNFRGLAYSNFLEAGVDEYARLLKERGVSHKVFTGGLSATEKDKLVKEFNAGKFKALVISSSGAEGLDLKGVKLVQVLEPHFNPSKIRQVLGRARRFESHEHLPQEERKVEAEHYLSTLPRIGMSKPATSIDVYLSENSDDKDELFNQVKALMKKVRK